MSGLEVEVRVKDRGVQFAMTVPSGTTVALVGPNGAGKSTVLDAMCGLLQPDRCRIVLDGRVLTAVAGGHKSAVVPPWHRGIGLLGQKALLFEHLSVVDNVAYGLRAQGSSARRARARADEWLEEVGLGGLGQHRPRELSGGQAQRVALARTLAVEPKVVALDEPLAWLDVESAGVIRDVLSRQMRGRTCVIVTHDCKDISALADVLIVMEKGHVVDSGRTAEMLRHPSSAFLATLTGAPTKTWVPREHG